MYRRRMIKGRAYFNRPYLSVSDIGIRREGMASYQSWGLRIAK